MLSDASDPPADRIVPTLKPLVKVASGRDETGLLELVREVLSATEQERHRWARNLHDETLQALGSLRRSLASALALPEAGDRNAIISALADVDEQIESLRRLIDGLRPTLLDQFGLEPALVAMVARARQTSSVQVDVRLALGGECRRVSDDVELAVYRLAQEALNNAIRHARADKVRLAVARRPDSLELLIADDGEGFDVETTKRGRGMTGMAEWVALARGNMEVRSRVGSGTTIEIAVPV